MRIDLALKAYGLTKTEAVIYQTLLKLLEAKVYDVAHHAQIPRTTTYKTLEDLKNKGLVLSFYKNNILYYTAESPNRLLDLLEEKKDAITNILPQLRALTDTVETTPLIKMYSGVDAIKIVKNDILETLKRVTKKDRELLVLANEAMYEVLPKYFPGWVKKRVEQNIRAKLILPASAKTHKEFSEAAQKKNLSEVRFFPPKIQHNASLNMYDNKIALFTLKKNDVNAIIIESATITELFRQFFLFNWEVLEKKV